MNLKLLTGAIVSSAFLLPGSASGQTADFNIVPQPLQVDVTNDAPFILNGKTSIVVASKSNDMKRNATLLASYIEQTTGVHPVIGKQAKNAATIVLTIDKSIDNAEGYKLDIDAKNVRIAGATAAGVFYGIQTLRKSLPVVSGKASQVTIPCATRRKHRRDTPVHRHTRPAQHQPLPLAPHRRPGMAHRDKEVSAAHQDWFEAHTDRHRPQHGQV